ncbi:hypothetical protein HK100_011536 [Physocladia obscura]|uniref:Uncharacterized protein n=1 Tax=Physocladia obscura TaxID=109957 RepID=A0AAD5T2J8_9FUNG|nr:hypothetical protein HK100_011536 [Physocladia obscura]
MSVIMVLEFTIWVSVQPNSGQSTPSGSGMIVWIVFASIHFAGATSMISYFYLLTYRFTSHQLNNNTLLVTFFMNSEDAHENGSFDSESIRNARVKLERTLLAQCVILSASMIVCYFPFWIYNIVSIVNGGTVPGDSNKVGNLIVIVFLAMDAIVTPLLTLYFKPEIRQKFVS